MSSGPPIPKPTNSVVCNDDGIDTSASRRRHERIPCMSPAMVFEITANDSVLPGCRATVRDISKSGLGMHSRKMYTVGARVIVLIATKDNKTRQYFAIVRHCSYNGDAVFRAGVEFIPPLQTESILRWMLKNCKGI